MRPDFYEEYARIESGHWWFIARRRIILTILNRFVPKHAQAPPNGVEGATPNSVCLLAQEFNSWASREPPLVLDIGIGSGVMLGYLEASGRVIGCDRERAALRNVECGVRNAECGVLPTAHFPLVQAEAEHLPFKSASLDLVTLLDLLEHTEDDESVLGDVGRVLRPGGFLCATVPAHQWLWGNQDLISRHVRRYQPGELERKIEAASLCILYRTYFNTFLFPLVALIRLIRRIPHPSIHSGQQRPRQAGALLNSTPHSSFLTSHSCDRVRSDFSMTGPGRLNDLLAWIFSQEARWLRRWRFPVGVSLLCVAQKKG